MSFITPEDSKIYIKKELTLRNGDAAITPTDLFAFDLIDGSFTIPEPYRERNELWKLGGGRNVAQIADLGYNTPEESLDLRWMLGTLLYYAMGICDTSGTTQGISGLVDGGTGTVAMQITYTVTAGAHAGQMVEFVTSGSKFQIVTNTAATLTLSVPFTTADISGGSTHNITKEPYTHVISEGTSAVLPSFGMHIEQGSGTNQVLIRDLLGCTVRELKLTNEMDAIGKIDVGIHILKSVTGTALNATEIPTDLSDEIYNWTMLNQTDAVTYIDYNNTPVDTTTIATQLDNLNITISNDNEPNKVLGDENAKLLKVGKREYNLTVHIYPKKSTLRSIRNTKIANYAGDIDAQFKWTRATNDTVNWHFDKLYLFNYPNALPSWDDKILGLDAEFHLSEGGSSTITIVDDKPIKYYERVQLA